MEILKRLEEDVKKAQERIREAEELIELGKDAGIDVAKQEAELEGLKETLRRFRGAIEKRKKP